MVPHPLLRRRLRCQAGRRRPHAHVRRRAVLHRRQFPSRLLSNRNSNNNSNSNSKSNSKHSNKNSSLQVVAER